MATFTINIDNDRYRRMIRQLSDALDDPSAILYALGAALKRSHKARHRQGQTPEGTPWAKLKRPDYPVGRNGGPLNRTGKMLGIAKGSSGVDYNVEGDTLRLGFYGADGAPAKYHQEGTRRGIPARPLLGFPESDKQIVEAELTDYLDLIMERVRNG